MIVSFPASLAHVHSGRYYKLLHQVGPIPAGIYRSEGSTSNEFHFSIGSKRDILFSLLNLDDTLLVQVPFSAGKLRAVKRNEFISHYFSSFKSYQATTQKTSEPHQAKLSCCSIRFAEEPQAMEAMQVLGSASEHALLSAN